ncbi:SMI1/KNR4 family protein [Alteromonadaceae bacterium M269]|nr:SMI1/KNR4 family protein [Alteromonadaceae bacterium M269]
MNITEKLSLVSEKLEELRKEDNTLSLFGASRHQYKLNKVIDEKQVHQFEVSHQITLPDEYRAFILEIGDGGAGPYYGLQRLEDSLFEDLDYKVEGEFVNPSIPFPFDSAWNMEFQGDDEDDDAYREFQERYFSSEWETGVLRLSNFGCGAFLNLVVNGKEKGNMWVDDRRSDGGIYPDSFFEQTTRTSFLDWYLLWLNHSLIKLKNTKAAYQ